MKLDAVNIRRFRSIEEIQLIRCGEFNVLIGKNNSGKSNILSAIQAFFSCITGDGIIIPELPFQKTIDFYGRVQFLKQLRLPSFFYYHFQKGIH